MSEENNTISVSARTYEQLGPFNKDSKLGATISGFPPGSGHWLTEWIFNETTDHYFIVGHEKRKDKETYFFRIENKEVIVE